MRAASLLLCLAAGTAAPAQHLDLGLGGGGRLNFTHVAAGAAGSAHTVLSPSLGIDVSYAFRRERLRLSSGLYRGVLNQSVLLDVPNGAQNQEFTAYNFDWQVPLRLHVAVLPLNQRLTVHAVGGVVLQLFDNWRTEYKGPYYAYGFTVDNVLWRRFGYRETHPLYISERRPNNWLLEAGAEASLRLGRRAYFDLTVLYQQGLLQVREFTVFDLPLHSTTRGSGLLLSGTFRYALKTWHPAAD
jgi:hypothetical protein